MYTWRYCAYNVQMYFSLYITFLSTLCYVDFTNLHVLGKKSNDKTRNIKISNHLVQSVFHFQINMCYIVEKYYDIINGVSISQQAGEGYFQNKGSETSRSFWTSTRTPSN